MSDELDWDISALREMVVALNRKGIEVKNKVANIFWQFRYQVTPYWEGENYNKVMEFVNEFVHGHGEGQGFKEKTDMVAYTIPKDIEDIINTQAIAGGGAEEHANLISAYDTGNSDVWEVPLSVVKRDGARRISTEKVQQFFVGTADPSVKGEVEAAIQKLNEYIAIFDDYESFMRKDRGVYDARTQVIEFKEQFVEQTNAMLAVVIDVATAEIAGIEDVNIETIRNAHNISQPGDVCRPSDGSWNSKDGTYTDPCIPKPSDPQNNSGSSGNGYDWSTDPCHKIRPGVKVPDGYNWNTDPCHFIKTGSGYSPVNNEGSKSTWSDPCHFYGPGGSTSDPCHFYGTPSSENNNEGSKSTWSDPCHFYGPGGSTSDPCHFYGTPSSENNNEGSKSTWSDPCHFYGPNGSTSDPCHFYN